MHDLPRKLNPESLAARRLRQTRDELVREALEHSRGTVKGAARYLGIEPKTLRFWMASMGLCDFPRTHGQYAFDPVHGPLGRLPRRAT